LFTSLTRATNMRQSSLTSPSVIAITLVAIGVTVLGAAIFSQAILVEAAALNASWQAPTTNVDGSLLIDLAGYRVYVATASPACHAPSVVTVASPVAAPVQGDTMTYRLSGLNEGTTYFVGISAVDSSQLESSCAEGSGTAHTSFTVTPSQVDFGSTVVGTSIDRTISVVNPGSTSVSLTVACQAPFTVISGSSYTIAPGATQNVVVRFSATSVATFTGSIAFTADGDTLSSAVTGTATRRARKSHAAASPAIATSDAM
jgi:hypothetical protein